jgi:hypothetical protein
MSGARCCWLHNRHGVGPDSRRPERRGDALAQVGLDEAPAHFEQLFDQRRLGARIGVGIGHALDHDAEQFGDGVADRVLADGDDQSPSSLR